MSARFTTLLPGTRRISSALLLLVCLGGCIPALSRAEANRLASAELVRYCQRNRLNPATFQVTGVTTETGCPWVFQYQSARPRYEVVIYVKRNRQLDLHALPGP